MVQLKGTKRYVFYYQLLFIFISGWLASVSYCASSLQYTVFDNRTLNNVFNAYLAEPPRHYSLSDVSPELQPALKIATIDNFDIAGIKKIRQRLDAQFRNPKTLPQDPAVKVYDKYVDSGVRVRIYEPVDHSNPDSKKFPVILWIHGGGMVIGFPEIYEAQSIHFAKEVQAVVVAVDYRLAPEYPYPAALNDCYATLKWIVKNAKGLNIDSSRIAVVGGSAGGNLAIALALKARDEKGPQIKVLMPFYPMLDHTNSTASGRSVFAEPMLTSEALKQNWAHYLRNVAPNQVPKYADPILETDWKNLPPVYTFIGDIDPLRDPTLIFADKLHHSGVPFVLRLYKGAYHAFDLYAPTAPISMDAMNQVIFILQRALALNLANPYRD